MYVRYFLWQFAGRGPAGAPGVSDMGARSDQDGVDWWQFGLPLALFVGFFGVWHHFRHDWPHALAVTSLFLATGLLIILYLNQADPQPRERDYAFVGSYFSFAIWIGVGLVGLFDMLNSRLEKMGAGRFALPAVMLATLLIMPINMLRANYHTHDRTGNYVAWDYSYNLLNSCKPNGIIFTNGDNDTFPLWYLQEVEGIRKDVRVVNLSLLNTDWYIQQLKDFEPKLPLTLTDQEILQMSPISWETQTVSMPLNHPDYPDGVMEWELRPTYADRFLRVQDRMVVQLIRDIAWSRPIYFAVTVAPTGRIGLEDYLDMQGLAYELKPEKGATTNLDMLEKNLLETYRYRGLGDESIYFNTNVQRLMQNVRGSYLQLGLDALMAKDSARARRVMASLTENIPEKTFPVRNKQLYRQMNYLYAQSGDTALVRQRIAKFPQIYTMTVRDSLELGYEHGYFLDDWAKADSIFDRIYTSHGNDGQIVGRLVEINAQAGRTPQARRYLSGWLSTHPGDPQAAALLDSLQSR